MIEYKLLTPKRGLLLGICPVCEKLMRRFVSKARLAAIATDFNVQLANQ
jgi:hypothetical protein